MLSQVLIATEKERILYLEQQLWNVRVLLGAIVGTLAGVLLAGNIGAVSGLVLGGVLAALGLRILSTLAGGGAGLLLSLSHFDGSIVGAFVGAVIGYLIAEIGDSPIRRRILELWWRK